MGEISDIFNLRSKEHQEEMRVLDCASMGVPDVLQNIRLFSFLKSVESGSPAEVATLLEQGADIDFQMKGDDNMFANCMMMHGNFYQRDGIKDSVELASISQGELPAGMHRCGHGNTALMRAVFFDRPEIVGLLLEKGANVYVKNSVGQTALDIADMTGNSGMKDLLWGHLSKKACSLQRPLAIRKPITIRK